jgi:DNA-binding MarR family transcriptional regulator
MNTQKLKQLIYSQIKDSTKTVYLKLLLTGDHKICYSNKQMVELLGVTKQTVIAALNELEAANLITRELHYTANGYILGRTITLK